MANKYYEENKAEVLALKKEKYQNDEIFREHAKKVYREKYHTDIDYKTKTLERAKSRYHTDPEYRLATIERSRKRNEKLRVSTKIKRKPKPETSESVQNG